MGQCHLASRESAILKALGREALTSSPERRLVKPQFLLESLQERDQIGNLLRI